MALWSVYIGQATVAGAESAASSDKSAPATDVKLLEDSAPLPTTQPETPKVSEGRSVKSSQVKVSTAGTVEMHVNDANLVEVLRMLSLQTQKNILCSKEVKGTVTANLFDVTVHEALDAILHANGYAYKEKGNFIFVYTAKELADIEKASRVTVTEVFHLNYTPATNAVAMIKPALSGESQVSFTVAAASGIETGTQGSGGNSHALDDVLVVTDYQENVAKAKKIIAEIDRRPQQILVEATILSTKLTDDNALGIDFSVMNGVDFSTISGVGSSVGEALSGAVLDNKSAGAMVDKGYGGSATSFTQNVPSKNGGVKIGIVGSSVAMFIQALESTANSTILANPKVLALNKQRGEVIVGRKDGYLTTTVSQTTTTQTVEFLESGTRLVFRPFIGDNGYIRMEIHPENSEGQVTTVGSQALPSKTTTEITTNIMVQDGRTIVIGGLFRDSSSTNRSQVPFLGNLPIAGALFRSQADSTTREEIIILLTPHIIQDDAVFAKLSEQEKKHGEQMRIGVRRGMMCFSRDRLAEISYNKAVSEMNKPNPDLKKVRWHLDCATNLNPTFSEAMELKQKITGKELTTVDNSSIRSFVTRMILEDKPVKPEPAAAAPATQPAAAPTAEVPTTQPTAEVPTTQPAAVAEAPATQPAQETAEVPTTQPQEVAEVPATQPSQEVAEEPTTQPAEVAEAPATQPAEVTAEVPTTQPAAVAEVPTTQPSTVTESTADVTVTELPADEK